MFELTPFAHRNNFLSDPFRACEQLERNFFGDDFGGLFTKMGEFRTDVKDNGDSYELEAELPGFEKKDINVDLDGDTMTISAKREATSEENNKSYVRRERSYGEYQRSFDVSGVEADKITAKYDNGVLRLTMPKKETKAVKGHRLEIQ